jgi:hypothetical protein
MAGLDPAMTVGAAGAGTSNVTRAGTRPKREQNGALFLCTGQ